MRLKRCPFCNSTATVWSCEDSYIIECDNDNCGCAYGGNMSLTMEEVIELWNIRAGR